ncbi:MAG TPA: DivIVA domain-containing protein [Acidimicrobiales bacterium]|nr:DivIVA domain-containing protein [Acidimicrobiales bacterium]
MTTDGFSDGGPSLLGRRVYDGQEVDAYVGHLHSVVDELRAQLHRAADRAAGLEARLEEAGWGEQLIGRTLVLAQRSADRTVAEAHEEAQAILADVGRRATALMATSRAQAEARLAEATTEALRIVADARYGLGRTGEPRQTNDVPQPPTPPLNNVSQRPHVPTDPTDDAVPGPAKDDSFIPSAAPAPAGGIMLDIRERWNAARGGSAGLFDEMAERERRGGSDFLAQLASGPDSLDDLTESPPVASPAGRAVYLTEFATPRLADRANGSCGVAPVPHAEVNGHRPTKSTAHAPGRLTRVGLLMLGLLSPGPMAHRARR